MEIQIQEYTKVLKKRTVLDHVSLTLTGNRIYGLKGKNGCGKTMLMRAMIGLIHPTSGRVLLNGKDLKTHGYDSVGMLIENPAFLSDFTGYENLKLLSDLKMKLDHESICEVLRCVGLDPEDPRRYGTYSLGMKQKLGVAAAIMGSPQMIILDEPINALDEESVARVRNMLLKLKAEDRIIVVACHDREELECLSDHIFQIAEGRIVGEYDVEK